MDGEADDTSDGRPTEVRYLLLGPTEITVDGRPAALPGPAERALLAQLLLAPGRTVAATALVDRLWSNDALPVDPVNALQIRVSKLRRALAALGLRDAVVRQGSGYRADVEPGSVDAVDFAARLSRARARVAADGPGEQALAEYDAALALWRGEPLSEFAAEPWAVVEAGRLTELRLAALTERAQLALALDRVGEVVGDLEPLVAQDPTLEPLAGLLMVALYRGGRQAESLEVYHRTREVLDESLGLEPSVTLRSLQERVLRQDPSLGRPLDVAAEPVGAAGRGGGPLAAGAAGPPRRTNLPAARPLVGRDEELADLTALLGRARLVTLVGPGGAGKTALALAAAARVAPDLPDGAYAVPLAATTTGAQVPLAVAEAASVPLDGAAAEADVRHRLTTYLGHRRLLLVLDNCEHVVDAAAALVDEVLDRCPHVTVLATSREALAVRQEVQVTVGPLATPPDGVPVEEVLTYPAARLFADRAGALVPGLALSGPDLAAVAAITRALDGLPLAVELAAARCSSMSPGEIADRLADRFHLLTTGSRTAEARQQTLRATVDWSYALLTEAERRVFDRVAVFRAGWTLTSAEAVLCDGELTTGALLDTVGRLVERSMLVVDRGATTRYRMLETLREYAAERLAERGETEELAARHAAHYQHLAASAERALRSGGQRQALRELREEQANLRAALEWLEGPAGDRDAALELAGSLGLYWHLGRHLEGRAVLGRLLASPTGGRAARAAALQALSLVDRPRACPVHPHPGCAAAAAESLVVFEELGDAHRAALSRVLVAVEGVRGADPERNAALLAEAEARFTADGDRWGLAVVGFVRMETAFRRGEEDAVRLGLATAAAFRQLDDPWGLSAVLYHLGIGLRGLARHQDAARTLEEAVDVATSAGLYNTAQWALAELGLAQLELGRPEVAQDLFDRAATTSQRVGDGAGEVLADYGHGLLAAAAGDGDGARARFAAAASGFVALGTPVMEAAALIEVARCDEASGAVVLARDGYERAASVARGAGDLTLAAVAEAALSRLAAESPRS